MVPPLWTLCVLTLAAGPCAQRPVRDLDAVMAELFFTDGADPAGWGGLGGKFGGRSLGRGMLESRGGAGVCAAIERGLGWLVRHQAPDGRWSGATFMALDDDGELRDGAGEAGRDVGATGIALLAFLGDGQNTEFGEHAEVVRRGLAWLCAVQDAQTGAFEGRDAMPREMLDHAIATWALVEAAGYARYPELCERARLALGHLARLQSPAGSWRTAMPDGSVDVAVTSTWAGVAIALGRELKLIAEVDPVLRPAVAAVRRDRDAVELDVLLRFFLGELKARGDLPAELAERAHAATAPVPGAPVDPMRCHLDALVAYQLGGRAWMDVERYVQIGVPRAQRTDGRFAGSFDPVGPWTGGTGGRVFSTALGVLTLETYYRFTRIRR